MPRHNTDQTWIKNHPLEGDGLITGFYNFLFKRNTKTLKPCKDVFIPDTIVFDHNFPRGWYTSDLKAKEISKKQGKELDAASIASSFSQLQSPNVLICASYMSSYEVDTGFGQTEMCTEIEFFNEQTLKEFVARKTKREGVLQRFLIPKGHRNSVIQAIWSPLIFSCKRRTNVGHVTDKVQCAIDPYPVAVTYEGPSHFSEEGNCAVETTAQIKDICKNIVEHFYNTEHKYITRMVLYFKVDEHNQLWLLWCGSLRVSDRGNKSQVPVNLAAVFTSPSLNNNSPQKDDRALYDADMKHLSMAHDAIFYQTYVRSIDAANKQQANQMQDEAEARARREAAGDGARGAENSHNEGDESWKELPGIQDQYRELCLDRDLVLSHIEDIFYEAYGYFLRHEPGNFRFEVDRKVAQTLSEELLHELMQVLKIDHIVPSDDAANDELWFSIPANHKTPIARMGDEAARWVKAYYREKEQELHDEAASMPRGQAAAAAAAAERKKKEEKEREERAREKEDEKKEPNEAAPEEAESTKAEDQNEGSDISNPPEPDKAEESAKDRTPTPPGEEAEEGEY